MGEMKYAHRIPVRKLDRTTPLRTPRCEWEDNIRMDFRERDRKLWTEFI
jgi:hypothetical protein